MSKEVDITIRERELTFCVLSHRITKTMFLHALIGTYIEMVKYPEGVCYQWDLRTIDKLTIEQKIQLLTQVRYEEEREEDADAEPSKTSKDGDKGTGEDSQSKD